MPSERVERLTITGDASGAVAAAREANAAIHSVTDHEVTLRVRTVMDRAGAGEMAGFERATRGAEAAARDYASAHDRAASSARSHASESSRAASGAESSASSYDRASRSLRDVDSNSQRAHASVGRLSSAAQDAGAGFDALGAGPRSLTEIEDGAGRAGRSMGELGSSSAGAHRFMADADGTAQRISRDLVPLGDNAGHAGTGLARMGSEGRGALMEMERGADGVFRTVDAIGHVMGGAESAVGGVGMLSKAFDGVGDSMKALGPVGDIAAATFGAVKTGALVGGISALGAGLVGAVDAGIGLGAVAAQVATTPALMADARSATKSFTDGLHDFSGASMQAASAGMPLLKSAMHDVGHELGAISAQQMGPVMKDLTGLGNQATSTLKTLEPAIGASREALTSLVSAGMGALADSAPDIEKFAHGVTAAAPGLERDAAAMIKGATALGGATVQMASAAAPYLELGAHVAGGVADAATALITGQGSNFSGDTDEQGRPKGRSTASRVFQGARGLGELGLGILANRGTGTLMEQGAADFYGAFGPDQPGPSGMPYSQGGFPNTPAELADSDRRSRIQHDPHPGQPDTPQEQAVIKAGGKIDAHPDPGPMSRELAPVPTGRDLDAAVGSFNQPMPGGINIPGQPPAPALPRPARAGPGTSLGREVPPELLPPPGAEAMLAPPPAPMAPPMSPPQAPSMGGFRRQVQNMAPQMEDAGADLGASMSSGMSQGIQKDEEKTVTVVRHWTKKIVDEGKEGLDSHSPSRKFEEIGQSIPAGMTLGIMGGQNAAINATAQLTTGVLGAAGSRLGATGTSAGAQFAGQFAQQVGGQLAGQLGGGQLGNRIPGQGGSDRPPPPDPNRGLPEPGAAARSWGQQYGHDLDRQTAQAQDPVLAARQAELEKARQEREQRTDDAAKQGGAPPEQQKREQSLDALRKQYEKLYDPQTADRVARKVNAHDERAEARAETRQSDHIKALNRARGVAETSDYVPTVDGGYYKPQAPPTQAQNEAGIKAAADQYAHPAIPPAALGTLHGITNTNAQMVGAALPQGFAQGIKDNQNQPIQAAGNMADGTTGEVKKKTKSRSPSQVMADIGRDAAAGFGIGMGEGMFYGADAAFVGMSGAMKAVATDRGLPVGYTYGRSMLDGIDSVLRKEDYQAISSPKIENEQAKDWAADAGYLGPAGSGAQIWKNPMQSFGGTNTAPQTMQVTHNIYLDGQPIDARIETKIDKAFGEVADLAMLQPG